MAEAAKKHTPREWSLDDYHRYVRITLGCGINVALCEMERRIVSEQALLICQEYDLDGNPVGGAVVIGRFDFLSNYTFQFDRGDRVRVVTRKPDAGLLPGGITSITKFDESDPKSPIVRMGPGRVMDGYYTIVERVPHSPASQTAPEPPKASAKPGEKPSSAQERRNAAMEARFDTGEIPGRTVQWDSFCHNIRTDCDALKGDPKKPKFERGFSDGQITRAARGLMLRRA